MKNVYHKKLGRFFPLQIFILGIILSLVGFFNLIDLIQFPQNMYTNIFLVVFGIFVLSARFGIKLSFEENKYKSYFKTYGITFGRWKEIPRIEHIMLIKIPRRNKKLRAKYDDLKLTEARYKLVLVTFYKKKIVVSIGSHQTLLDEAKIYANDLNVKIIDCGVDGQKVEVNSGETN